MLPEGAGPLLEVPGSALLSSPLAAAQADPDAETADEDDGCRGDGQRCEPRPLPTAARPAGFVCLTQIRLSPSSLVPMAEPS